MEEEWIEAATLAELPAGRPVVTVIGGRRIALVNVDGTVHGIDAVCPHRAGPLGEGMVWGGQIECPWHHHRYDLATGRNIYPANVYPPDLPQLQPHVKPARVFSVRIEKGRVFVRVGEPG
jgi:nitrite reductase (NADH) small subunit